jgi:hypothetical protein
LGRSRSTGGQAVKEITHQILWSSSNEKERKAVMAECERAVKFGGYFKIENRYTDNWYSFITIYYRRPNQD